LVACLQEDKTYVIILHMMRDVLPDGQDIALKQSIKNLSDALFSQTFIVMFRGLGHVWAASLYFLEDVQQVRVYALKGLGEHTSCSKSCASPLNLAHT